MCSLNLVLFVHCWWFGSVCSRFSLVSLQTFFWDVKQLGREDSVWEARFSLFYSNFNQAEDS